MKTAVHRAPAPAPAINLTRRRDLFSSDIVMTALKQSFFMLRPDVQWKNPVMFVVEIGAVLTLLYIIQAALGFSSSSVSLTYFIALDIWLWLTVLFANFATAIAEERGKAQAETLRKTRVATPAFRLRADGTTETVSSAALKPGDVVVVQASQIIPGDGDVIEGGAVVNEAAITGESAPVIREAGGDRSGVTGGTTVLSDRIVVRISAGPGESFLDKMTAHVERNRADIGADRLHRDLHDRRGAVVADGVERRAIYDELSRPFRSVEEPGYRRPDPGRAHCVPHSDDDRRALSGDRHRRDGSRAARQHHRQERQGGGGRGRRRHRDARQDRHDHHRRSPGARVHPARSAVGRRTDAPRRARFGLRSDSGG